MKAAAQALLAVFQVVRVTLCEKQYPEGDTGEPSGQKQLEAEHIWHVAEPTLDAKVPVWHGVHVDAPADENVPTGHAVAVVEP